AQRVGLDVLHVHYAIPHATSAWIAKEMLGPEAIHVVTTLHGTDITLVGQDPSFKSITEFSIRKSDGITAVSEFLRRETVEHFGVAADAIEGIPNFVDLDVYRRDRYQCHRSKFSEEGEKIVIHISNFRPVKRVADVVRVFTRIAARMPARLLLVGDGPDRARAELVASKEGVMDRVIFLGKQESVAELLACADLILLPSASEAFGLAALEAMAGGVPAVATNVGGAPERVRGVRPGGARGDGVRRTRRRHERRRRAGGRPARGRPPRAGRSGRRYGRSRRRDPRRPRTLAGLQPGRARGRGTVRRGSDRRTIRGLL